MKYFLLSLKIFLALKYRVNDFFSQKIATLLMQIKSVTIEEGYISKGIPKIFIYKNGKFIIGKNFKINNTIRNNPIGRNYQCIFTIGENALLKIGNDVGMSGTVIVAHKKIIIEKNVKLGGNVCIYDTDFHSLKYKDRINQHKDKQNTHCNSIHIGENVFIGAHSTILKGVNIGNNSIIGACSVVTKDIPKNEIWAGNPAKYIRQISDN